jgi:hypothetical protein
MMSTSMTTIESWMQPTPGGSLEDTSLGSCLPPIAAASKVKGNSTPRGSWSKDGGPLKLGLVGLGVRLPAGPPPNSAASSVSRKR